MRSTPKTLIFSIFSKSSPYRIGRWKWYNWGICNFRLHYRPGDDRVDTNLQLIEPLKAEGKLLKDKSFPLYVSDEEVRDYKSYLEKQGLNLKKPIILVAVATRIASKQWPRNKMQAILRNILQNYDVQLVFNYSSPEEENIARKCYEDLKRSPKVFINVQATTLRQLCCLCKLSHFFFGNEGGPRHISQSFQTPSLAIYPPGTDKNLWLPDESERYQGISPDDIVDPEHQIEMTWKQRMNLITVEKVWEKLRPMLDRYVGNQINIT